MNVELEQLQTQADQYKIYVEQCADTIKQLSNYNPEGFSFRFVFRDRPILEFDLQKNDGGFCISFFMAWHEYYSRRLSETLLEIAFVKSGLPQDHTI